MPFKKKKEETKAEKIIKEEETTTEKKEENYDADLLNMPQNQADYIYFHRVINELIAIRAAIEALTEVVKSE